MFSPDPDILASARRDLARQQLQALLVLFGVGMGLLLLLGIIFRDGEAVSIAVADLLLLVVIAWLRSRDRLTAAAFLASLTLLASAVWGTWTTTWGLVDSAATVFVVTVVYGTLLLPRTYFLTLLGLTIVAILMVGLRVPLGLARGFDIGRTQPIDVALVCLVALVTAFSVRRQNSLLWDTLHRAVANERDVATSHAELQRRQEQILASEQRWRSLVTAAPDWIVQLDRTGAIIFANRDGFFTGSPLGRNLIELVDDTDREQLAAAVSATVNDGATSNLELDVRSPGGPRRCIFDLGPLESATGAIVLVSDVTERHLLHAQLQQTQKLESIGQLAGGIAHDFNNLLTAMTGHADLAQMKLAKNEPAQADLDVILSMCDKAGALTAKILAFSRRQPLSPQPVNLEAAIDEMELLLVRLLDEDIQLEKSLAAGLPSIEADPGTLEQVVMNLVVNARDAVRDHPEPEERRIVIATRLAIVDDEAAAALGGLKPGPYVELSVSDTGVGMNEDVQARIFEPFFTTKATGRGTGLGLAMVYGIVTQSGGAIRVESTPLAGSTLRLYWPTTEAAALASLAEVDRVIPLTGNEHLLVVEDDPAVRQLAETALSRLGYRITVAADGQEALDILTARDDIDLVFSDVVMPRLNGFQLRDRLPNDLPVIFSSGHTDLSWLPGGKLPAPEIFLPKPYALSDLALKVRSLLDQSSGS